MAQRLSGRLRMDVHLHGAGAWNAMPAEVKEGLAARPRTLPPKYFYDRAGSEIFERITALPEYYPTQAERRLLASVSPGLLADMRPAELVELGSGSCAKVRLILDATNGARPLRYVPFDVSADMVRSASAELLSDYPHVNVHAVIGDFDRHLREVPPPLGRRLVLFLGGTIGNLDPPARRNLLSGITRLLDDGDRLLLGVDLVKDVATLEAAYNDPGGVTAEFNRNILRAVNRELGADFWPERYGHLAFYNREQQRIEMHLVSDSEQTVNVGCLGLRFDMRAGETIHTENSYKFTVDTVTKILEESGLFMERWHTDGRLYGLALAGPA